VTIRPTRVIAITTAGALAAIGGLHVAWGRGSAFPFPDRAALADVVVGNKVVPGARESFAVAGLLGLASALVADALPVPRNLRSAAVLGVAAVLATRAAFGFTGNTGRLVPGSDSPRFVAADRRLFAPLCTVLALGALTSVFVPAQRLQTIGVQRRIS
jgi:hypothetical protein